MRLLLLFGAALAICAITGCSSKSQWNSAVVRAAENPRNGLANFFPVRAEVVEHSCGLFRRHCATVRLVDETGFSDVFTYLGDANDTSITWTDFHHLQISCKACGAHTIELQRHNANYMDNIYIDYRI